MIVSQTFGGDIMSEAPFVMVSMKLASDPEIPATAKSVYMALCSFRNNTTRIASPSRKTIRKTAGVGETTLSKSLKILEDGGFIEIEPNFIKDESGRFTGERTSNSYKILDV